MPLRISTPAATRAAAVAQRASAWGSRLEHAARSRSSRRSRSCVRRAASSCRSPASVTAALSRIAACTDTSELPVTLRAYCPAVGITRHATRVHLSTRTDPAGMTVWVVAYTVSERGRQSSFSTDHVSEVSARRMVANLLADRAPRLSVEDVSGLSRPVVISRVPDRSCRRCTRRLLMPRTR